MSFAEQLEQKALSKAVLFFDTLAIGDTPALPEAFGAEILAQVLASLAGIELPTPLEDAGPRPGERPKVGAMIRELPEAAPLLMAHGWKRKSPPQTRLLLSAFLANPGSQWSSRQLVERMPMPITVHRTNGLLYKLATAGLLERAGHGVYTLKTS